MKAKDIIQRHNACKNERSNAESMWEYMDQFVVPYSAKLYGSTDSENEVNWRKRDIYDSTAPIAAENLAARIQSDLISPSVKWFDLPFESEKLNSQHEAKEWLEESATLCYKAIQRSDFNLEIADSLIDLVGYGNLALAEEEDEDDAGELDFTAIPVGECCFEVGSKNQLMRFYRELKWTALQCVDKFGEEGLPEIVTKAFKDPNNVEKFTIIYAVYERDKKGLPDANTQQFIVKSKRPFGFKYVLETGMVEMGDEGGCYEMPVFFTRWRKTAGSVWGNGPGFKVLSTIMDLNETKEQILEGGGLDLEPPLMTTQKGIISQLDRTRGGITIVNDLADVAELPGRGSPDLAILDIREMQEEVRSAYYEDKLELKESPAMTATEVNARLDKMFKLLGPTGGRLMADLLDKMIMRTFSILYRAGKLPTVPQSVKDAQAEFEVEYIGPLARSQKMDQANATAGWLGQVGSLIEQFPRLRYLPKEVESMRGVGVLMGVPVKFMNSEDDIKKAEDQDKKDMQERQKIETAQAAGDAGQSLGAAQEALPSGAIEDLQRAITG